MKHPHFLKFILFRISISGILFFALMSCTEELKTVVYINSYHEGFPPSDKITEGINELLPPENYLVKSFFMDTKRNPSEVYIKQVAEKLLDSIKKIQPDVLIVSDDNALKYIVVPNFQDDPQAIVFCGVNWSIDQYDISACNITGIIEVLPVDELVNTIKSYYPGMKKLFVLNENTTTSRKTQPILDTLLGKLGLDISQELVDNFESWKAAFLLANDAHDIIYVQTKGAIKGWDDDEARTFVEKNIKIPVITCEDFMMPYAVLGLTQLSKEQGLKAAEFAKEIIDGTDPVDIPITRNTMSKVWINTELARVIGFEADDELLKNAIEVN